MGAVRFAASEVADSCLECHEDEYGPMAEGWLADFEREKTAAEGRAGADAIRDLIGRLEKVRPIHNIEYAMKVLRSQGGGETSPGTKEP